MDSITSEELKRYAQLAVMTGCNLQPGQTLFVSADVTQVDLVRAIVKCAYEHGAGDVTTFLGDERIGRMQYEYRSAESFKTFPVWRAMLNNSMAEQGAALLFVSSEDPQLMDGIDQTKMMNRVIASNSACKAWRDGMDFGRNVWCIIGAASPAWAQRVFPNEDSETATAHLWRAILHTARCDGDDPAAAWEQHRQSFAARCAWLNNQHFDALHYQNHLGTDIVVGLPEQHIWNGGGESTVGGTYFFPNIPTEEIFTSPDRTRTEGRVVSSLPLNCNGTLIADIDLTFHKGRVTSYHASQGEEALAHIVETDDGSHYLGEAALIPKTSPIKQTGVLFLNTLFDENAACHFALGMGFPDCFKGGRDMSKEDLLQAGINESATHVDFMLGTDDLSIDGIHKDGSITPIFTNGDWAITSL
ncbi:MAG: aminopeptidase [Eggerthellaceae bacterium]|jgi:aminopeptidase|nr:aminopeptidase [Eggerthellaceae bacterium]MCH4221036.1 aminopeptidase [Eggerthellaceae bacterium]